MHGLSDAGLHIDTDKKRDIGLALKSYHIFLKTRERLRVMTVNAGNVSDIVSHCGLALLPTADTGRDKLSALLFKRQKIKYLLRSLSLKSFVHYLSSSVLTDAVCVPFLNCFLVQCSVKSARIPSALPFVQPFLSRM